LDFDTIDIISADADADDNEAADNSNELLNKDSAELEVTIVV
jgi:hypothetical protein